MTNKQDKIYSDNPTLTRMANHFASLTEDQKRTAIQNLWETMPPEMHANVLLMANLTVTALTLNQAILFIGAPEQPLLQVFDTQTIMRVQETMNQVREMTPKPDPSEYN